MNQGEYKYLKISTRLDSYDQTDVAQEKTPILSGNGPSTVTVESLA